MLEESGLKGFYLHRLAIGSNDIELG